MGFRERDPSTWFCEAWWPPQWQHYPYAGDFALLRAFGQELLSRAGAWQVRLTAADPVVQFVDVSIVAGKVAEVSVDIDVPEGQPRRFRFSCATDWEERSALDAGDVAEGRMASARSLHKMRLKGGTNTQLTSSKLSLHPGG